MNTPAPMYIPPMNPPQMPAGFAPPAAPQPQAFPAAPAPMSEAEVYSRLFGLITKKVYNRGMPVFGDQTFMLSVVNYLIGSAPLPQPITPVALLSWLESIPSWEVDAATRAAATMQPPVSSISTQTAPQVAQQAPAAPPAPAPAAVQMTAAIPQSPSLPDTDKEDGPKPWADPVNGKRFGSLRGFKMQVTRTHKADWSAFCTANGLDPETGFKVGQAPPPAVSHTPTVPPPTSGVIPPMLGQEAPQPASVAQPTPVTPPVPVAPPVMASPAAMPSPPAQHPVPPPLVHPQAIYTPPATPAAQPVAQPSPAPLVNPQAIYTPPATPPMEQFANGPAFQPSAPAAPVAQSAEPSVGYSREHYAKMLGGAVDLMIVRLIDAAAVSVTDRADVNQLALVAEKMAKDELRVADLATGAGQYSVGKQASQRHFGSLLTKHPKVVLFLNGYDPILPSGDYMAVLYARVMKCVIVQDSGRTLIEPKF